MTYATSYRPSTRGQEGDTLATLRAIAKACHVGTISQTQAIEEMRREGAYETEIATALEA